MKKVLELITAALTALTESKAIGPRAESIEAHLKSCASNAKAEIADATPPKGKDSGFTKLALLMVVVVLGLLCLTLASRADSFGLTNRIDSAVSLTGPATNTAGLKNGGAISVLNNDWAGFYFSGYSTTNTNSTVTASLVRGWPPSSSTWYHYDATGTNVDGTYWETSASKTLSISITGTGIQSWFTNLEPEYVRGASAIAVLTITNSNAGANGSLTNVDCGLNKKIIPIRYP